ncbi:MAG TPA: DUF6263 family protein [Gemmatimonadaceae bacterium]|nr:DUF6263 family protein [Gemmatimonadaceae bacterium]
MLRSRSRLALLAALLALGGVREAAAQRYSLQLRPRAGDTLRLKLEQTTEFEGTKGRDKPANPGAKPDSVAQERTGLRVYTRIAVEATDLNGAEVTAITDSVRLTSSVAGGAALEAAARAAEGRRVRLHVAPDGATTVSPAEGPQASALRAMMTQMPATLPREPVEIGQSWVRTMEIPVAPPGDPAGSAALSGTFRLDSVSRGGDSAYVSLTGRLARSASVPYLNQGSGRSRRNATVSTSGSITGSIVIDRTRGWIVDVRTSVVSRSLMQESGGAAASARMWMKITQRVQVY